MADLPAEFRRTQIVPALALALACVGAASMVYYHLGLFIPRVLQVRASIGLGNGYSYGGDFYPIWLTARASRFGHVDLYSDEVTRQTQTGVFGHPLEAGNKLNLPSNYRQYAYPAFTNLLLWPCGLLDFPSLRIVLTLLLVALTAISIWMWLRALRWDVHPMWIAALIVLTSSTYQLLDGFFALQPGLFVGFFLAAAALALRAKRLMLAGALCSLTLIKPQVTALAIVFLLLWSLSSRTRARYWQGFLAMTSALMIGSLWVWPHWVGEWISVLREYRGYARPALVSLVLGTTFPKYTAAIIIAIVLIVGIILMWRARQFDQETLKFWLVLSLLLAITTIALLPGQAMYDQFILIPGILLVLRYRAQFRANGPVQRILLLIGAVVLFWPWFSSFVLLVLRPLFSPEVFYSIPVFALPIRNVASLPFAVIALLAWSWKSGVGLRELDSVPPEPAEFHETS
jgi:hypothetical protein